MTEIGTSGIVYDAPVADGDRTALEIAMDAGLILLENGAEIARVEETIRRINDSYGVQQASIYVITNGLFITGGNWQGKDGPYTRVQQVPVHGAQLNRVVAVNQLSREIASGEVSVDEARRRLETIRNMKPYSKCTQVAAACIASGCFCILFGGTVPDVFCAALAGMIMYAAMVWVYPNKMSKLLVNLLGGMITAGICILLHEAGFVRQLIPVISGGVITLVPGFAFTNGVRDLANGDYLSGTIRLLDAILVFVCIAVGVSVVGLLYQSMGGAWL